MDEFDELVDEVLAEDFMSSDEDDAYERWRDDQCDALYDALKAVYKEFVEPVKHGYYKDRQEKFLEHAIGHLKYFTGCDLTAAGNNVNAIKREPKKILKVEKFGGEKDGIEEVSPTT